LRLDRAAALCLCLAATWVAASAQAEAGRRSASDFHRRAVLAGTVSAGAPYAVALSQEAVAALKHGQELRVFDSGGREVPSLVHSAVSHGEIIDRPVTIFNRAFIDGDTQTLSIELDGRKPQPVNEFVFEIGNEQYSARVRVEASQDGESWQILRDGLHLIRHAVKDEKIAYLHNVLRVPTARFRFYRFTLRPTLPNAARGDVAEEPLEVAGVAVREVVRRGSSLTLRPQLERHSDDRDDDSRHHYYKLDLGRENLGVDHVEFDVAATDFTRPASLWEWSPERNRRTRRLASTVIFQYDDDVHTEFSGFTTDARVLILMIDQGDDEPVPVSSARASRPRQQVRFIGPASMQPPLALYFDPDKARKPRYDLERRLREHAVTSFTELEAGPLEQNPSYAKAPAPRSESIPYLLYAIVIPLVLALGWYVVRTIQRGLPPDESPPS
jgi:hypothetical protein